MEAEIQPLTFGPDKASNPFWSPDGDRIVFLSFDADSGNTDIRVMDADGSEKKQLTSNASADFFLSNPWSPNGQKLLFISDRSGTYDLWSMNPDGNGKNQLTTGAHIVPWLHGPSGYGAVWSPQGDRIAYTSCWYENEDIRDMTTDGQGNELGNVNFSKIRREADIWVMNADGGEKQRLTTSGNARQPAWRPHSDEIAFLFFRSEGNEVRIMRDDGSEKRRITYVGENVGTFDWSPDGSSITYNAIALATNATQFSSALWTINADGDHKQQLTSGNIDFSPVFSPDGDGIAFLSQSRAPSSLFIMNSNGSSPVGLAPGYLNLFTVQWSPDGKNLAVSDEEEVYVIPLESPATAGGDPVSSLIIAVTGIVTIGLSSRRRE
ncbi:PD40 domain-containing protein [Methanogenium sp. MK-MG]|uniref:PD40 domain-containing protein n=1 Tax=Methanogenium sp. MK-MG TaxID=2599926 RepID=UPI0013EC3A89|nr:PD40 domain-containing protein [Methanogenium sp. MK-MG]